MSEEIKNTIEAINKTLAERKEADAAARLEIKKHGEQLGETKEKLDKIQTALGALDDVKSTLEKLEKLTSRPVIPTSKSDDPHYELNQKHLEAFKAVVRNRNDHEAHQKLREVQAEAIKVGAVKAVSVGTPANGGYAMPEYISRDIDRLAVELSPMRSACKVITVGGRDYKHLVDLTGLAGGWVGETTSRSETGTPTLAEVAPTFGGVYAYPQATNWSLADLFFDVETWLRNAILEQFDVLEGIAFHSGNGTNKPTGLLAGSFSSAGDDDSPARAFGTIEYIPTGKAGAFNNTPFDSPPAAGYDVFSDTIAAIRNNYLANASWMMNKNTKNTARKFKDANGDYIWEPGLQKGMPSTILGYPVLENKDMANVGSNTFPVVFGDLRQAYLICDLPGMWMMTDQVTTPGYTKYYVEKRVGGKLIKDEAVKVIKAAAS